MRLTLIQTTYIELHERYSVRCQGYNTNKRIPAFKELIIIWLTLVWSIKCLLLTSWLGELLEVCKLLGIVSLYRGDFCKWLRHCFLLVNLKFAWLRITVRTTFTMQSGALDNEKKIMKPYYLYMCDIFYSGTVYSI